MGLQSASVAMLTVFLWGGTAVSNQFALDDVPPVLVGAIRFGLAAVFMVGWCLVQGTPLLLKRGQWRHAWILGALLFVQIGSFNFGTMHSSSSHASILVNSYIFWVAACEHLIQRTIRLRWWQLLGLILSGLGCGSVLMATGPSAGGRDVPTLSGDLILVLSGLILSVKILYTKHSVQRVPPGTLILWHDLIGTLLFLIAGPLRGESIPRHVGLPAVIAFLYGGLLVSGFCFGANAMLLRKHGASQVSVFSFATPICGVLLGVLLRDDQLSAAVVLGGVLVALGIFLVNAPARKQPR